MSTGVPRSTAGGGWQCSSGGPVPTVVSGFCPYPEKLRLCLLRAGSAGGKAFNLWLLVATALAQQDEIEEACTVGLQALELASGLRSACSVRYIKDLQRCLRRHADSLVVHAFNSRVAECLPAVLRRLNADDRGSAHDVTTADHAAASSMGTQRTSSASSASGSRTRSAR